jgi:hypothetical protein
MKGKATWGCDAAGFDSVDDQPGADHRGGVLAGFHHWTKLASVLAYKMLDCSE